MSSPAMVKMLREELVTPHAWTVKKLVLAVRKCLKSARHDRGR